MKIFKFISRLSHDADAQILFDNINQLLDSARSLYTRSEELKKSNIEIQDKEVPFDFSAAIKTHIDWKMKLSNYLQKSDGSLDHSKVCLDNACALGKWIYGDGERYKQHNYTMYEDLRRCHASFHKAAGEIIRLINTNKTEKAKQLLGLHGDYLKISEETVQHIENIKNKVLNNECKAS